MTNPARDTQKDLKPQRQASENQAQHQPAPEHKTAAERQATPRHDAGGHPATAGGQPGPAGGQPATAGGQPMPERIDPTRSMNPNPNTGK